MSAQNSGSSCNQRPCQTRPPGGSFVEDSNEEISTRPILFVGVHWIELMRRFLLPRSDEVCSHIGTPRQRSQPDSSEPINVSHVTSPSSRPSRTSIFDQPQVIRSQAVQETVSHTKHSDTTDFIPRENYQKKGSSQIAQIVFQAQQQARQMKNAVSSVIEDGRVAASETVNVIRDEEEAILRYSIITMSGLLGYVLGVRQGKLRRVLYTFTGATSAAAVCYPRETVFYNQKGLDMVHQFVVLGIELFQNGPRNDLFNSEIPKKPKEKSPVKEAKTLTDTPPPKTKSGHSTNQKNNMFDKLKSNTEETKSYSGRYSTNSTIENSTHREQNSQFQTPYSNQGSDGDRENSRAEENRNTRIEEPDLRKQDISPEIPDDFQPLTVPPPPPTYIEEPNLKQNAQEDTILKSSEYPFTPEEKENWDSLYPHDTTGIHKKVHIVDKRSVYDSNHEPIKQYSTSLQEDSSDGSEPLENKVLDQNKTLERKNSSMISNGLKHTEEIHESSSKERIIPLNSKLSRYYRQLPAEGNVEESESFPKLS